MQVSEKVSKAVGVATLIGASVMLAVMIYLQFAHGFHFWPYGN